jgi:tellurite resistance protein TerC
LDILLSLLHSPVIGKPLWLWLLFALIVVSLLAFDLGVLHKDDREIGVRESLALSAGYIGVGIAVRRLGMVVPGRPSGIEYLTGFMIEKSLSMDNVFVIAMIFTFFAIPRQYQHRVLFWGILGVIVLRAHDDRRGCGTGVQLQRGCCICSARSWWPPA